MVRGQHADSEPYALIRRTLPEAIRYLAAKSREGVIDPEVLVACLEALAMEIEREDTMFREIAETVTPPA